MKQFVMAGLLGSMSVLLWAENGLVGTEPAISQMPGEGGSFREREVSAVPPQEMQTNRLVAGGRGTSGVSLEISGGIGGIRDVEGRGTEQIDGRGFTGALNLNLSELGVNDGSDSRFLRAKLMNSWVTFFLNYYQGSVSGQGTTDSDLRLNVDGVEFAGRIFDYLLIPGGGQYSLELENTWLGVGMHFTPLTVNPDGRIRFTPWLHLGLQYVALEYRVDAGATTTVQFDPQTQRTFAFRGSANSEEQALMPEYGFGGEVRLQLWERAGKRVQLVGDATYKRLDLQDGIGSLSFDNTSFEDVDFTYAALEVNVYVLYPLTPAVDLICGVYVEQVDMDYTFAGDRRVEGLDREVNLEYTLYGFKAGLKF